MRIPKWRCLQGYQDLAQKVLRYDAVKASLGENTTQSSLFEGLERETFGKFCRLYCCGNGRR